MKCIFCIFITLATIVVGENDFNEIAEVDYNEVLPILTTLVVSQQDPGSEEAELKNLIVDHNDNEQSVEPGVEFNPEAEKDLKLWVRNLNCSEALMGEMKCIIVKNLSEEYYNDPDISPSIVKTGIDYLIRNLLAEGQVDPQLHIIIHKHFKDYLE